MPVTQAISPTQSDLTTAVGAFLMDITGYAANQIVVGQPNRVAEPSEPSFIIMMPTKFRRLSTNVDTPADSSFVASAAGQVLTVTDLLIGDVPIGAILFGVGVPAGITIQRQIDGTPGGLGDYAISQALNLSEQGFAAGGVIIETDWQITVQLDFHSDDNSSTQMAATAASLLRDPYGISFFAALPAPQSGVVPLYGEDPAWRPFINAEGNYEWRWVVEAQLEVNQTLRVPQQFFDSAAVQLVAVPWQVPGALG